MSGRPAWPDPNATALDRARTVARTYRDALVKANPQQANVFDEAARRVGEGWVCGVETGDQVCTVAEASLLLAVSEQRVRQLVAAGRIRSAGKTASGYVLFVASVLEYQRTRRVVARRDGCAVSSPASGTAVSAASARHRGE